jgi:hypothetical protein
MIPQTTLTDQELVDKVQEWVSKLCKTGGQAWSLRVPVDVNHDPDVLISELCRRFKKQTEKTTPTEDSILTFLEIREQALLAKKELTAFPFDAPSFQYGAEWARDVVLYREYCEQIQNEVKPQQ